MGLITSELLKECKYPKEIQALLDQAELAINTWQKIWSPFLSAPVREEVLNLVMPISDLKCFSSGGFEGAERHRICFMRNFDEDFLHKEPTPVLGLNVEGNFLFDNANVKDFRFNLEALGAYQEGLGDIWLIGDRGAQAICSVEIANELNGKESLLRDVPIRFEKLEIYELQTPVKRVPKKIRTVEASTRIDAISSAGFGLSRAKIVRKIKEGQLRLNWEQVSNTSKSLIKGDLVQLENKGTIEITSMEPTKKQRWRIELMRK